MQAVLLAPHCGDGSLYHLQGIRMPGVSMDHAPNTGHHCRISLSTTANTATAAGATCGGGLGGRSEFGCDAKRRDCWSRGGH